MEKIEQKEWMTGAELVDYLRISRGTLKEWVASNSMPIPVYRLKNRYRFKTIDVISMIVQDSQANGGA